MTDLEKVMSRLGETTRRRVQQANEVKLDRLATPSLGLTLALNGGLGYGRQSLVWGNKSAGKSSLCLEAIARAQADGAVCAWVDGEKSYDPEWATSLGVDTASLIYSPIGTIEDMAIVGTGLMEAGVDVIVVDSISSLLSSAYFEKDSQELKELGHTKQIGSEARDLANAVKMLNFANKHTALVLISQIRNKITTYGAMHQPTGGHAVMFFSTTSIKLWSSARPDDQIIEKVKSGNKLFDRSIGRPVNWTVEFNKIGPPGETGKYDFYYSGDRIGVDNVGEILDIGERLGIINKSGAWITIGDKTIQGRIKAVQHLRENPEVFQQLKEQVNEQI
jgi:recombination protein RecA